LYSHYFRWWRWGGMCAWLVGWGLLARKSAMSGYSSIQLFDHCPEVTNLGEHSLLFNSRREDII
jgi:hypothetical protein